ncbi:MAG: hypothetical protein IJ738_05700 [Alphaproteobacteria bacterium]|nr:hypothetical protein [Alphaproteobacteria bacterium]MBR1757039.1 hypothetical protein [Alphaproteobacteria bacterium]
MKKTALLVLVSVIIVSVVMFSVLPVRVVLLIFAAVGVVLIFGALLRMSLQQWVELEKEDPEKAKKMWADALMQIELNRYLYQL